MTLAVEPAPNDSSEQIESSNDISLEGTEQVMPTSPWYAPYVAKARVYQILPAGPGNQTTRRPHDNKAFIRSLVPYQKRPCRR